MYATYPSLLFLDHCDSNKQRLKIMTYFPVQFLSIFLSLLVFLSPDFLLSTLFSSTLILLALHVINEVLYHYEYSGKIITQPSSVLSFCRYSLGWQLTSRGRQTHTWTSGIHFCCWVWHLKRKTFSFRTRFYAPLRNCEKRLLATSYLSMRMQQTRVPPDGFSLHLIFRDFRKSVEKILELDLKFDKNDEYFMWRPM